MPEEENESIKRLKELWQSLKENLKNPNLPSFEDRFSEYKTFKHFVRVYQEIVKKQKQSGMVGEIYFALLITELIEEYHDINIYTPYSQSQSECEKYYELSLNGEAAITKKYDICICKDSRPKIFVEIKKNIDMVEKDLLKAFLKKVTCKNSVKLIEIIWEERNNSKRRDGSDNDYMVLLKYFKQQQYLHDFFYFYRFEDNNDEKEAKKNFEDEIKQLEKSLSDSLNEK